VSAATRIFGLKNNRFASYADSALLGCLGVARRRFDFAEAYLVACAESTGIGMTASFDRSLDRIGTIERIEPPQA
jgi:predicted nucleic acid-binding protein